MVFSSLSFLLFFLPPLFLVYYAVPARYLRVRNFVLLLFSLFFYAWGGMDHLPLLLISIAVNYAGGLLAGTGSDIRRRLGLWGAVVCDLALLAWFKYAGFFARTLTDVGLPVSIPDVALPIGISFFTFQGLSYVADVYRRRVDPQKNPLYVALYVAFFPQLVAGPIVRYTTVAEELSCRRETVSDFACGVSRFLFGLGKKMLLANAMGEITDAVFAREPGDLAALTAWVGAVAYTMQIYFDFSAYSDMAIGLGRMFGFHFQENFDYPYTARSVREFWRRWHISLSTWFRDYVYIPLGGSRRGSGRTLVNLLAVWLLTGLWHGADWTFVVWGLWFFLLLAGERFLWGGLLERLPAPLTWSYTMLAVVISWVIFRSGSMGSAISYLGAMLGGSGTFLGGQGVYCLAEYWPEWLACVLACMPWKRWAERFLAARPGPAAEFTAAWGPVVLALGLLGFSYVELVSGSFNPFIYFQF